MIESALYSAIKNASAVAALVGTRVYRAHLPQAPTLPAVAFSRISTTRWVVHSGSVPVQQAIFQVSCWGADSDSAGALAKAVSDALNGYTNTSGTDKIFVAKVDNVVELPDPETRQYLVAVDIQLTYKEG
jgi:hypothetical protein